MNPIQAQLFLMFLGGAPRERATAAKTTTPTATPEQGERRRALAKRRADVHDREMQLFDEGHSHESARAIVRGEMLNGDKMYNEDMHAGVLI